MNEVNEQIIAKAIIQANASMNFEELATSIVELKSLQEELLKSYNLIKEKKYEPRSLFN